MIDRYVYRDVLLDDVSMNEYVVAKINVWMYLTRHDRYSEALNLLLQFVFCSLAEACNSRCMLAHKYADI